MITAVQSLLSTTATQGGDGLQATADPAAGAGAPSGVKEPGFDSVMAEMVAAMATDIRRGEQASIQAIRGEATTHEVVQAVMSAERSLQTALAIRDKIVTAYLEVSRMAI